MEVPPRLIAKVSDRVPVEVKACQARSLAEVYPIVFPDAIQVKGWVWGHIQTLAVCLALALNSRGRRSCSRSGLEKPRAPSPGSGS